MRSEVIWDEHHAARAAADINSRNLRCLLGIGTNDRDLKHLLSYSLGHNVLLEADRATVMSVLSQHSASGTRHTPRERTIPEEVPSTIGESFDQVSSQQRRQAPEAVSEHSAPLIATPDDMGAPVVREALSFDVDFEDRRGESCD